MSIQSEVKDNREKINELEQLLNYDNVCRKEHNNAEKTCLECEVIRSNV